MSVESVGANEIPGRVGAKPENPFLATFRPYIPAETVIPELTARALIVGTLLGIVFGASSLYLVLKVGLTVSASIPVAVISIAVFRLVAQLGLRNATILENNIVQTAGSAGESIAFGVGVTMPAIMILGFDLELTRVMLVAVLGGLLGILMMIPLRRALIVAQHGFLKYPEGTACAEVLKAGASDESRAAASHEAKAEIAARDTGGINVGAKTIFTGFGIGVLYQAAHRAFFTWKEAPEKIFGAPYDKGSVGVEVNPALLGVGYVIGPRIASIMCAGGVLAYLVLIPTIAYFGGGETTAAIPPGAAPIRGMGPNDIRGNYILYIGAGAVAAGGIISLFRSLPTIWHGLKGGLSDLRGGQEASARMPRTDQDISMKYVLAGIVALIAMIMAFPQLGLQQSPVVAFLGALMIVAFGFLFVTVSSRLTGEIGSSSNPISGMTVATLLLTCLIFLLMGWTGPPYYVTALSIGAIVCIAASNGGTTSQDLKTGFLVGSTPKYQQIAILVGALTSALILGPILIGLNENGTIYARRITFSGVDEKVQGISPGEAAALPAYTEDIKPREPGTYRVLTRDASSPKVEGLGEGEYLVNDSGKILYKIERNFTPELRADMSKLGHEEKLKGSQAADDGNSYRVWQKTDTVGGREGRYLVDAQGVPQYIVDPAINGQNKFRPNGQKVEKFDAPKATLMSYIIKGILNQQLPWNLVLIGVMIAIVLEMAGIPSLAFAVGVYLPLSASSPIFIGGMVRWRVDRSSRRKHAHMTEEELVAESDKSPGVLMASGYIAGAALAGIVFAFMAGYFTDALEATKAWMLAHNPFFDEPPGHVKGYADLLSLLPFAAITVLLYAVGREWILAAGRKKGT
ncbi:MAG: oligopeptide transporter, OPT family [Pyrinomonadaceae bacterium]|nr:oligopeptide transporter, OPT family [Pyrinomonadaceae bacterium]